MTTTDLLEFLRARLDEDEQTARRAGASRVAPGRKRHWHADGHVIRDPDGHLVTGRQGTEVHAEHIARWDPARALAEVEAKRVILELLADEWPDRLSVHPRASVPRAPRLPPGVDAVTDAPRETDPRANALRRLAEQDQHEEAQRRRADELDAPDVTRTMFVAPRVTTARETDPLVAFLRARVHEDQAAAERETHYNPDEGGYYSCPETRDKPSGDLDGGPGTCDCGLAGRQARALAEVEAKRRIIDEHSPREIASMDRATWAQVFLCCRRCAVNGSRFVHPCLTLRLLALPYRDHVDYRDEWTP